MNDLQRLALAEPRRVLDGMGAFAGKRRELAEFCGWNIRVLLAVERWQAMCGGAPVWHGSGCVMLQRRIALPHCCMPARIQNLLWLKTEALVRGVGDSVSFGCPDRTWNGVHVYKRLSEEEIALLPSDYMDLPPLDFMARREAEE